MLYNQIHCPLYFYINFQKYSFNTHKNTCYIINTSNSYITEYFLLITQSDRTKNVMKKFEQEILCWHYFVIYYTHWQQGFSSHISGREGDRDTLWWFEKENIQCRFTGKSSRSWEDNTGENTRTNSETLDEIWKGWEQK